MPEYQEPQLILNKSLDRNTLSIRSIVQNGNDFFIPEKYKNDFLPIQTILNSIFDRQTNSICISVDGNVASDLSDYSGQINVKDLSNKNVLSLTSNEIIVGNEDNNFVIRASNISYNGNSLNTANGLVKLDSNGVIPNALVNPAIYPNNSTVLNQMDNSQLTVLQDVQFTVKTQQGNFRYVTLQQLQDLYSPKLEIIQD